MQYIKNYQKIFFTVKKSYSLLIEKERTEFKTILLIFLFASIFDTIALSSVYPLVSIVSQPSLIETNKNFVSQHLHLHHIKNKRFNVSDLMRQGLPLYGKMVQKELKNCIVLCGRCHDYEHFKNG